MPLNWRYWTMIFHTALDSGKSFMSVARQSLWQSIGWSLHNIIGFHAVIPEYNYLGVVSPILLNISSTENVCTETGRHYRLDGLKRLHLVTSIFIFENLKLRQSDFRIMTRYLCVTGKNITPVLFVCTPEKNLNKSGWLWYEQSSFKQKY